MKKSGPEVGHPRAREVDQRPDHEYERAEREERDEPRGELPRERTRRLTERARTIGVAVELWHEAKPDDVVRRLREGEQRDEAHREPRLDRGRELLGELPERKSGGRTREPTRARDRREADRVEQKERADSEEGDRNEGFFARISREDDEEHERDEVVGVGVDEVGEVPILRRDREEDREAREHERLATRARLGEDHRHARADERGAEAVAHRRAHDRDRDGRVERHAPRELSSHDEVPHVRDHVRDPEHHGADPDRPRRHHDRDHERDEETDHPERDHPRVAGTEERPRHGPERADPETTRGVEHRERPRDHRGHLSPPAGGSSRRLR